MAEVSSIGSSSSIVISPVLNFTTLTFCSFFFQAEDGIRDRNVTGVQTCALPICPPNQRGLARLIGRAPHAHGRTVRSCRDRRSEERRVGKECRYGGSL